jgi:prolyl 4-hydroxylase
MAANKQPLILFIEFFAFQFGKNEFYLVFIGNECILKKENPIVIGTLLESHNIDDEGEQLLKPLLHLCEHPSVWVAEDFLSTDECNQIIHAATSRMSPSHIYDTKTGKDIISEVRTSLLTFLKREENKLAELIEEELAALLQVPPEYGEPLQVLNYQIGQEYRPHHDYFDPEKPGNYRALAKGGQRFATVLIYLNTVEAGGETHFPLVDLKIRPKAGDALIFYNLCANGALDEASLHASLPVIQGEKWVATKWFRQGVFSV